MLKLKNQRSVEKTVWDSSQSLYFHTILQSFMITTRVQLSHLTKILLTEYGVRQSWISSAHFLGKQVNLWIFRKQISIKILLTYPMLKFPFFKKWSYLWSKVFTSSKRLRVFLNYYLLSQPAITRSKLITKNFD